MIPAGLVRNLAEVYADTQAVKKVQFFKATNEKWTDSTNTTTKELTLKSWNLFPGKPKIYWQ